MRGVLWVLVSVLFGAGCDRGGASPSSAGSAQAGTASPKRALEAMLALRHRRAYTEMSDWVVPGRAQALTDTLSACDTLLNRERQLREFLRDRVSQECSDLIDFSRLAHSMEVFSNGVELLDENVRGTEAEVTFVINRELPTKSARLVLGPKGWQYDPGDGFDANLPRALRELADGLRRTFDDLHSGAIQPARFRNDAKAFAHELRIRLGPGLRLLPQPAPASRRSPP